MKVNITDYLEDALQEETRVSAQFNGEEFGHIILREEFGIENYNEFYEGKKVAEFVNTLLEDYDSFYTLEYLYVEPKFIDDNIDEQLLDYVAKYFSDKPIVVFLKSYVVGNKQIDTKYISKLYKKFDFTQLYGTEFFVRFEGYTSYGFY